MLHEGVPQNIPPQGRERRRSGSDADRLQGIPRPGPDPFRRGESFHAEQSRERFANLQLGEADKSRGLALSRSRLQFR